LEVDDEHADGSLEIVGSRVAASHDATAVSWITGQPVSTWSEEWQQKQKSWGRAQLSSATHVQHWLVSERLSDQAYMAISAAKARLANQAV
jgi:hypothetical protein